MNMRWLTERKDVFIREEERAIIRGGNEDKAKRERKENLLHK